VGIQGVSLDKHNLIAAIEKNKGIVAYAADDLNCSRTAIFNWAKIDPDVKAAIDKGRQERAEERVDQKEIILDKAFQSVIANLNKYDVTTTIFVLKCLDKWLDGDSKQRSILINAINRPYDQDDKTVDAKIIS
jgi:hypothetical protein